MSRLDAQIDHLFFFLKYDSVSAECVGLHDYEEEEAEVNL